MTEEKTSRLSQMLNIAVPLLLTIVGSIVVLEIGFRQLYTLIPLKVCASDPIIGNYICQPNFVYDKPLEIAYRYKPNLKFEGYWDPANPYLTDAGPETRPSDRSDTFWYIFETDDMGFPNPEPTWKDKYDIIITGDSFTIRSAEQSWIDLLREETDKEILTLGVPSWTTLNEVAAVQKWGLDKDPEWVILAYFEGNDLINAQQFIDKQASGLDWREYDLQDRPWYTRLVLGPLLRHWLFDANDAPSNAEVNYRYPVTVNTNDGAFKTVLKDIHLLPISADYDTIRHSNEFAAITNGLVELDRQLKAQDARLLVVYIPSKEHLYWSRMWDAEDVNNVLARTVTVSLDDDGRLAWDYQYRSYDFFNEHHGDQMRALEDFAAENNIEFLNLTPTLWQKTIELGELYHYADSHWNQAGNQLVSDIIRAYIENEK